MYNFTSTIHEWMEQRERDAKTYINSQRYVLYVSINKTFRHWEYVNFQSCVNFPIQLNITITKAEYNSICMYA